MGLAASTGSPYVAYSGVSYAGRCDNQSCKYYKDLVSWSAGEWNKYVDQIDPHGDSERSDRVKCPNCNTKFQVEEVLLSNIKCYVKYRYYGHKDKQKDTYDVGSNDYWRLGKDKDTNKIIWKDFAYLMILKNDV